MANATVIAASLSKTDLEQSINDMITEIDDGFEKVAKKLDTKIGEIQGRVGAFSQSIREMANEMKSAFGDMGATFDAMAKGMKEVVSASKSVGSGKGKKTTSSDGGVVTEAGVVFDVNTDVNEMLVKDLEKLIEKKKEEVREEKLISLELENQVRILQQRKNWLQSVMTSDAKKALQNALNMPMDSLDEAERKLETLENVQNTWNEGWNLSVNEQRRLASAIDRTKKKVDKLMEKNPKTLEDVMGMSEDSIDAIAKKMKALRGVKIGGSDEKERAENAKRLREEYERLLKAYNNLIGKSTHLGDTNNALGRSFNYIRNRLTYALSIGAMTKFVKNLYEVRAQYELLERSLGVLVGSFEKGSQIFQELNAMAMKSPFTLMELGGAAKQLTAYDFAANEVVDTTRRLADISAALGVPMERLTYNLGQIRAQTVLTARDARDFANAGLPIVKALADRFSELEGRVVSTGDVYERMSKKMVTYNDVMAVMYEMTDEGGKFFDFQAKQAETLKVQLANLTLAWNNALNELGKANDTMLKLPLQAIKFLAENLRGILNTLSTLGYLWGGVTTAMGLWLTFSKATNDQLKDMNKLSAKLALNFRSLGRMIKSLVTNWKAWAFAIVAVGVQWYRNTQQMQEQIRELNNEISEGAKQAAQDWDKFLSNKGNQAAKQAAEAGKLAAQDAEKAWESLREQIEQTTTASEAFIAELLRIEDINTRVVEGFKYAEKIREAEEAMRGFTEYTVKIEQDGFWSWLGFGEGLISKLEKYAAYYAMQIQLLEEHGIPRTKENLENNFEGGMFKSSRKAFLEQLKETAQSISNFIDEQHIEDPLQINVMYERIRATIKQQNPKLTGEMGKLFDIHLDEEMNRLQQAISKTKTIENEFIAILKNSRGAFVGLTEDVFKKSFTFDDFDPKQQAAIERAKKSMLEKYPEWEEAIRSIVSSEELPSLIGVNFAVAHTTKFQKVLSERMKEALKEAYSDVEPRQMEAYYDKMFGKSLFFPTEKEGELDYVDRLQTEWAKATDAKKRYENSEKDYEQALAAEQTRIIKQLEAQLDLLDQPYQKDNKKDTLADTLKDLYDLVKNLQSEFDRLTKRGVSSGNALREVYGHFGETLNEINIALGKEGLDFFDIRMLKGKNPRELLEYFERLKQDLIDSGLSNPKRIKTVETAISNLRVEVRMYDVEQVTKGLNSELGKLKEEYELAVELDANPELNSLFTDMLGLDKDELEKIPRTAQQAVKRLEDVFNEQLMSRGVLKERMPLSNILNKRAFEALMTQSGLELESNFVKALNAIREYANNLRLKEQRETIKNWNTLLDKYGELQTKLLKITKESAQERRDVIAKFGTEEEVNKAFDLTRKLNVSADPEEIARLQGELAKLLTTIIERNPNTTKLALAIDNAQNQAVAKAYWEDFKEGDLYTTTFENMANMSVRALDMIIRKLNSIKDKVKEDPASMKALVSQVEKAETEIAKRDIFKGIVRGIKMVAAGKEEALDALKDLADANKEVADAEQAVKDAQGQLDSAKSEAGRKRAQSSLVSAQQRLEKAQKKQESASVKVAQANNKTAKGINLQKTAWTELSNKLGQVSQAFSSVSSLFREAGMDEIADAIDDINKGFTVMTTVIGLVNAALEMMNMSNPWLLAIAGSLAVIVGLVSLLSGEKNKRINKQIEESERTVKELELAYKNLQETVEDAYGAMELGAKRAAIENKRLQLVELERQLLLERSRDTKKLDADAMQSIREAIQDLRNEIENSMEEITNSMLGISSVGDAAENLVSSMLDAFKQGEDYMKVYKDSFDDMIDSMIVKAIMGKVIGEKIDALWNEVQSNAEKRAENDPEVQRWKKSQQAYQAAIKRAEEAGSKAKFDIGNGQKISQDEYLELLNQGLAFSEKNLASAYAKALTPTVDDIKGIETNRDKWLGEVNDSFVAFMDVLGIKYGQDSEKQLSSLQQGISSITEDTASAIEAYMNSVSQQVYYHSSLLEQIRDSVVGLDLDVSLGVQSQILLQLQNSYQIQMSIQSMLAGWSNASGQAVRVEMIS